MKLFGTFLLVWFGIALVIYGVAIVVAILLTVYETGGTRAVLMALVIVSSFPAFFIAVWLRRHDTEPDPP